MSPNVIMHNTISVDGSIKDFEVDIGLRARVSSTKIEAYEVMYSSNKFPPRIWLKSAEKYIGQLVFQPNNTTLPADESFNEQVNLYYHLDDFENILHLLRNEKQRFLVYVGSTASSENGIKALQ